MEVVNDFYEDQPPRDLKHHCGIVVPRTTETTVWVHPPDQGVAVALHGLDPMVLPTTALRRLSPRKQPLALGVDVREKDGALLLTLLHGRGLPKELARYALRFLYVQRVDMSEVSVRAASSNRGDFPLSELLSPRDDTWWISTFKEQFEHEWVELATSADGLPRRVAGVKMKIPPLALRTALREKLRRVLLWRRREIALRRPAGGDVRPGGAPGVRAARQRRRRGDRPRPRLRDGGARGQHPRHLPARAVLAPPPHAIHHPNAIDASSTHVAAAS